MRILLLLVGISLLLSSCGEPKEEAKIEAAKPEVAYPELLKAQLDVFPDLLGFELDSAGLDRLQKTDYNKKNGLTIEMVRLLSSKLNRDELTQPNYYYLNDFYKIQNHKLKGTLQQFKDSLDIGMTENANCYPIGKLVYGDSLAIILWQVNYDSFDACPMFEGIHVMGSLIQDGKMQRCMQLAAIESAMDPPVSGQTYQLLRFKTHSVIERIQHTEVMEEDNIMEQTHRSSLYRISRAGYIKM